MKGDLAQAYNWSSRDFMLALPRRRRKFLKHFTTRPPESRLLKVTPRALSIAPYQQHADHADSRDGSIRDERRDGLRLSASATIRSNTVVRGGTLRRPIGVLPCDGINVTPLGEGGRARHSAYLRRGRNGAYSRISETHFSSSSPDAHATRHSVLHNAY